MRSLDDIHKVIEDVFRKERGTFLTPAQKDRALDAGQKEFLKEGFLNKDWDAIQPFKVTNASFTTNSSGVISPVAPDYEYFVSIFAGTVANPIPMREVCPDELPNAITSKLRPISTTKPIFEKVAKGVNIYPEATYSGKVTYYRTPTSPKFAFTQSGRAITYDNSTSVQLEVTDIHVDKVIAKALGFLGISMSEDEVIQFANLKNATT
jgi:hypothetical protein